MFSPHSHSRGRSRCIPSIDQEIFGRSQQNEILMISSAIGMMNASKTTIGVFNFFLLDSTDCQCMFLSACKCAGVALGISVGVGMAVQLEYSKGIVVVHGHRTCTHTRG